MQRLIAGHKRFLKEVFPQRRSHFHLLSEGQAPEWLFITCSDSRVVPDLILGTEPGDLFITRNAGNVVPLISQDVDGCTATIEYAVNVLKVRDAILCGHSDCGALKAAVDKTALVGLPKAERWLNHVESAFSHRQPLNPADGESAELASLIRGNVVAHFFKMMTPAFIQVDMTFPKIGSHRGELFLGLGLGEGERPADHVLNPNRVG